MEIGIIIVLTIVVIADRWKFCKLHSRIDELEGSQMDLLDDVIETQNTVVKHEGDVETLKHLMKDVRHNLNRLDKKVKNLSKDEK